MNNFSPMTSQRFAYVNIETPIRDPLTIFHSPFKNGRRNPEYSNPTLMSSSIFYGNDQSIDLKISQKMSNRAKSPQEIIYRQQEDQSSSKNITTPERQKAPRLKRQFDNSKENIKDHFDAGLTVPSEKKRTLKKYLFGQPTLDYYMQLESLNMEGKIKRNNVRSQFTKLERTHSSNNLQESALKQRDQNSYNKSTYSLQKSNSFVGETSNFTPTKENSKKLSEIYQERQNFPKIEINNENILGREPSQSKEAFLTPPKNPNSSYLFNNDNGSSQNLSQTPHRSGRSRTMGSENQYKRDSDLLSIASRKSLLRGKDRDTENTSKYQEKSIAQKEKDKYFGTPDSSQQVKNQQFKQMHEQCDKCINEKILTDKKKKKEFDREKEREQLLLLQNQVENEVKEERNKERQRILSIRRQYSDYIKVKKEEDQIFKVTKQLEKSINARQLAQKSEHEEQQELEQLKAIKAQKRREYSEMLREQIKGKQEYLKQNEVKEIKSTPQIENDKSFSAYVQIKESIIPQELIFDQTPKQLKGKFEENNREKSTEKRQSRNLYFKNAHAPSQSIEREKQIENMMKQLRRSEFQEYLKQKQTVIEQQKIQKQRDQEQERKVLNEILAEESNRMKEEKDFKKGQKATFCNSLKKQIQERDESRKRNSHSRENVMPKSEKKPYIIHPASQKTLEKEKPCTKCKKIVPFHHLANFNF